jgi:phosphatidylglycerophosphate synthase
MEASPEPEQTSYAASLLERSRKRRPRPELLADAVFRPLANLVVLALLPLRVPPTAVVLANAVVGVGAAVAIGLGELVLGALLLQAKTVLDNADGQLARASGRASALGRYLDTEADLAVNVAVFAALAHEAGAPWLAAAALGALTLVLSADFNEEVLYRRARGETVVTQPAADRESSVARVLAWLYRLVFAPQDRFLQGVAQRRLERMLAGVADQRVREQATVAYHDGATSAVLANLGLSTQLVVLGVCLVAGVPTVYLWLVLAGAALLPVLQLRRELAARRTVTAAAG